MLDPPSPDFLALHHNGVAVQIGTLCAGVVRPLAWVPQSRQLDHPISPPTKPADEARHLGRAFLIAEPAGNEGPAADEAGEGYPRGPVTPGGRLWDFLDRYPNLGCDLSAGSAHIALSRDQSAGRDFLLKYQDRCLFGRDYFDSTMHDFIKSIDLPQEAYAKIMAGNALRLVPL